MTLYVCVEYYKFSIPLADVHFEEDSDELLEPGELDLDDDFEAELGSAATVSPSPLVHHSANEMLQLIVLGL